MLSGSVNVTLSSLTLPGQKAGLYDVVLTSPPYGDSRTTVQYGAVSGICLDVITRIPGLEDYYRTGRRIDGECLGSKAAKGGLPELRQYWAGAGRSEYAERVSGFLIDFEEICRAIAKALAPGGVAVMVVGRRSVGGFRVKLDEFASATMGDCGLSTINVEHRRLVGKTLPSSVNRFARSNQFDQRDRGRTKTMDEEIIISFKR